MDRIHAVWAAREATVSNFDAQWDQQTTTPKGSIPTAAQGGPNPPADVTHAIRFHLTCDGNKARLLRSGVEFDPAAGDFVQKDFTRVFDGQDRRELWQNQNDALPEKFTRPGGFLHDIGLFDDGDWRIQPVIMTLRPLSVWLGGLDLERCTLTDDRAVIQGTPCTILKWKRSKTLADTLYIAGPPHYELIRREINLAKGLTKQQLTVQYASSPTGELICRSWAIVHRFSNGDTEHTAYVESSQIVVNQKIPPATFDFRFPPGTVVTHERTAEKAIALSDGSLRPISRGELAAGIPFDELMNTPPLANAVSFDQKKESRTWLFIVGGLLVLAAGVVGCRKWFAKGN